MLIETILNGRREGSNDFDDLIYEFYSTIVLFADDIHLLNILMNSLYCFFLNKETFHDKDKELFGTLLSAFDFIFSGIEELDFFDATTSVKLLNNCLEKLDYLPDAFQEGSVPSFLSCVSTVIESLFPKISTGDFSVNIRFVYVCFIKQILEHGEIYSELSCVLFEEGVLKNIHDILSGFEDGANDCEYLAVVYILERLFCSQYDSGLLYQIFSPLLDEINESNQCEGKPKVVALKEIIEDLREMYG